MDKDTLKAIEIIRDILLKINPNAFVLHRIFVKADNKISELSKIIKTNKKGK